MNKRVFSTRGDDAIFTSEDYEAERAYLEKQIELGKRPEAIARAKQIDDERAQFKTLKEIEIAKRAYQVDTTSTVAKIAAPYTVKLPLLSWSHNAWLGDGEKDCLRVVEITQDSPDSPPMLTILNSQYPEKIKIPADANGLSLVFYSEPLYEDAEYKILPYKNKARFLKNVNLTPNDNYIDKHSVFIVSDDKAADIINNILGSSSRWQRIAEPKYGGARRKSKKVKKSRKQRKSIKNRKTKHSKK
jgi:hypothetical protein